MRLTLPLSAARPLAFCAVGARLFTGLFLDMPWLYNASWISALVAALACAPLGLLADRFLRASEERTMAEALEKSSGKALTRGACAALGLLSIYEAAVVARVLCNTVRHVALSEASAISLLAPLLIAVTVAACYNGEAIGGAARVWIKCVPVLLLIVIWIQAKSYRLGWLFPLLGPGADVLATGAVGASGWLSMGTLVWLCVEKEEDRPLPRAPLLGAMLDAAALGAVLLALMALMAPPSVRADLTRTFQLDKLLANGRIPQGAQLPLIILWYNSLLFALVTGVFVAAKLAQIALPALDGRIALLISGVAVGAVAMLGWAEQGPAAAVSEWIFPAVGALMFVLLLPPALKGGKPCARSR